MSWRTVVISTHAKLDYRLDYLIIRTVEDVKRIHLSEIALLLIENTAGSLSTYLLCELQKRKIKVIFCDHERNPSSELVPFCAAHDSSAKIRNQLKWKEETKQELRTEIVKEKIRRQQLHLARRNLRQEKILSEYLRQVQWNDASCREAHAAKVYFHALFGTNFSRSEDSPVNAALNYSYTLLLSALNREISSAGYLNQLGIFHSNIFNPFNLACDLIEPLRPLVDSLVVDLHITQFRQEEKHALLRLFEEEVYINRKKQTLLSALQVYTHSMFKALEKNDLSEIQWIHYGQ